MNETCLFEGYMPVDCSNMMWELIEKMHSKVKTDSMTAEASEDTIPIDFNYGVSVSVTGNLIVNLNSETHPLVNSYGTLELHDKVFPYVDEAGTLILE